MSAFVFSAREFAERRVREKQAALLRDAALPLNRTDSVDRIVAVIPTPMQFYVGLALFSAAVFGAGVWVGSSFAG